MITNYYFKRGAVMEDYKKLYYTLFNEITTVIEQLQAAQRKTEAMFIEMADADESPIDPDDG